VFLYLSIVIGATLTISGFNIILDNEPFLILFATGISVLVEIIICGVVAFIFERLPDKWYNMNSKFFKVSKKEQRFYQKLGIRSWKDKVWELGFLGGFRKNKIRNPDSSEYIYKFMIESCKGMTGHIVNTFAGFLVIFILPIRFWLRIGLPVALVGAFLNLLPTLVLRYNLPKLAIAYKRAIKKEENLKQKYSEELLDNIYA